MSASKRRILITNLALIRKYSTPKYFHVKNISEWIQYVYLCCNVISVIKVVANGMAYHWVLRTPIFLWNQLSTLTANASSLSLKRTCNEGIVKYCSNSIANLLKLLLSFAKPSIYFHNILPLHIFSLCGDDRFQHGDESKSYKTSYREILSSLGDERSTKGQEHVMKPTVVPTSHTHYIHWVGDFLHIIYDIRLHSIPFCLSCYNFLS